ncbi:MAG: hypothetical protein K6G44_01425, partial [Lentisphaeria bacterium]|nr:hypothetical protein [Lentisphaeria bacterium]
DRLDNVCDLGAKKYSTLLGMKPRMNTNGHEFLTTKQSTKYTKNSKNASPPGRQSAEGFV